MGISVVFVENYAVKYSSMVVFENWQYNCHSTHELIKVIVFGLLDTNKLIVIVDALIGNALKSLKSFKKLDQFSLI